MSRQDHHDTSPHDLTALSESSFEQDVLDEHATHLVLFWASWSKDCMAMRHDLERFLGAQEDSSDLRMGSVDIEANAMLSIQYNIRTLPTLIVFHKGLIRESHEGYLSTHMLNAIMARVNALKA